MWCILLFTWRWGQAITLHCCYVNPELLQPASTFFLFNHLWVSLFRNGSQCGCLCFPKAAVEWVDWRSRIWEVQQWLFITFQHGVKTHFSMTKLWTSYQLITVMLWKLHCQTGQKTHKTPAVQSERFVNSTLSMSSGLFHLRLTKFWHNTCGKNGSWETVFSTGSHLSLSHTSVSLCILRYISRGNPAIPRFCQLMHWAFPVLSLAYGSHHTSLFLMHKINFTSLYLKLDKAMCDTSVTPDLCPPVHCGTLDDWLSRLLFYIAGPINPCFSWLEGLLIFDELSQYQGSLVTI